MIEDNVCYCDPRDKMEQPLDDNRVNRGEDGNYPKTINAIYAQSAFVPTIADIVENVAWAAHSVCETDLKGVLSANGCRTGNHRAHVSNLTLQGVLNDIRVDGKQIFNAMVFTLHDVKPGEISRVVNDVRTWLRSPWCDGTVDEPYARKAVRSSSITQASYNHIQDLVASINCGDTLARPLTKVLDTMSPRSTPKPPSFPPPSATPSLATSSIGDSAYVQRKGVVVPPPKFAMTGGSGGAYVAKARPSGAPELDSSDNAYTYIDEMTVHYVFTNEIKLMRARTSMQLPMLVNALP